MPKSKYNNKKTKVGDIVFDSKKEAERYRRLKAYENSGVIENLQIQVPFKLEVNGRLICKYIADFTYEKNGEFVVEDAKGMRTTVYNLKKKLMLAVHNIKILET